MVRGVSGLRIARPSRIGILTTRPTKVHSATFQLSRKETFVGEVATFNLLGVLATLEGLSADHLICRLARAETTLFDLVYSNYTKDRHKFPV